MTVALATRGMIRPCCKMDAVISRDTPQMKSVLEVRPTVRRVTGPAAAAVGPPVVSSVQELKPETTDAKGPAPIVGTPKPVQTSAQELKPQIVKVEEED